MSDLTLTPIDQPFRKKIAPPGSKSLTNRALVLAALAKGTCVLRNVLFADDTRVMLDGLRRLGFALSVEEPTHTVALDGRGGEIPAASAELFCGNSGTTIRFLTALCCLGQRGSTYTLDGVERMRQRPLRELVDLLRNVGARVEYAGADGFP
ncbi:MAG: 3-phosphoshikimate 1-carboxyvinyltransferase, partial [Tepidisphaeraceae bacterium]